MTLRTSRAVTRSSGGFSASSSVPSSGSASGSMSMTSEATFEVWVARLRWVGVGGSGELDLGGDFGPAAVAVDAAVGAHGAEDGVAGECYIVDGFDEGVEGGVQTFAALEEQAGGAGVAVDGAIVGELVVLRELPGSAPVDEFLFDGFAFGVVADDAAAAVAFE